MRKIYLLLLFFIIFANNVLPQNYEEEIPILSLLSKPKDEVIQFYIKQEGIDKPYTTFNKEIYFQKSEMFGFALRETKLSFSEDKLAKIQLQFVVNKNNFEQTFIDLEKFLQKIFGKPLGITSLPRDESVKLDGEVAWLITDGPSTAYGITVTILNINDNRYYVFVTFSRTDLYLNFLDERKDNGYTCNDNFEDGPVDYNGLIENLPLSDRTFYIKFLSQDSFFDTGISVHVKISTELPLNVSTAEFDINILNKKNELIGVGDLVATQFYNNETLSLFNIDNIDSKLITRFKVRTNDIDLKLNHIFPSICEKLFYVIKK